MADPMDVDARRPAVAWVARIPTDWLTIGERFVLHMIACDSYDGLTAAPGHENLSAWTGIQQSTVRAIIARLCAPTAKRPALLRREQNKGRYRATLVLLQPAELVGTLPADQPADQPAEQVGTLPAEVVGTSLKESLTPISRVNGSRTGKRRMSLVGGAPAPSSAFGQSGRVSY